MASTRHCFFGTIGEEGCRGLHVSVQLCFTLLEAAIKGSELQLERVAAATGGWLPITPDLGPSAITQKRPLIITSRPTRVASGTLTRSGGL
jgi:hypothetical protein